MIKHHLHTKRSGSVQIFWVIWNGDKAGELEPGWPEDAHVDFDGAIHFVGGLYACSQAFYRFGWDRPQGHAYGIRHIWPAQIYVGTAVQEGADTCGSRGTMERHP